MAKISANELRQLVPARRHDETTHISEQQLQVLWKHGIRDEVFLKELGPIQATALIEHIQGKPQGRNLRVPIPPPKARVGWVTFKNLAPYLVGICAGVILGIWDVPVKVVKFLVMVIVGLTLLGIYIYKKMKVTRL